MHVDIARKISFTTISQGFPQASSNDSIRPTQRLWIRKEGGLKKRRQNKKYSAAKLRYQDSQ